jgi:hypothetical protein
MHFGGGTVALGGGLFAAAFVVPAAPGGPESSVRNIGSVSARLSAVPNNHRVPLDEWGTLFHGTAGDAPRLRPWLIRLR